MLKVKNEKKKNGDCGESKQENFLITIPMTNVGARIYIYI